ncbi:hypothetical protein HDU84_008832, partial [Entophlyctis sp. JEL0112]
MSPSYPQHPSSTYPAFSMKSPLGKGFPAKSAAKPGAKNTDQPLKRGVAPSSAAGRPRVEDEYIRNLQQQVYLLELETRYLRTNAREANGGTGSDARQHGTLPLNDAIKGLKSKYIELQENHKMDLRKHEDQIEKMKTNEQVLVLKLQACQAECDDLKAELKSLRDHHTTEKDKLYGELLAHRKKSEIAASEHARLQKTQQRLAVEKQQYQSTTQHALDDAKKYRDQVDELLHINATLK